MTCELQIWIGNAILDGPDFTHRSHRFEDAAHDLGSPRTIDVVGSLGLEELGVGEDDAELIVQAMEEKPQVIRLADLRLGLQLLHGQRT